MTDHQRTAPEGSRTNGEHVATATFYNGLKSMDYEEGRIYDHEEVFGESRPLDPNESVVSCPRCAGRFADTQSGHREAHLKRHLNGDDVQDACRVAS